MGPEMPRFLTEIDTFRIHGKDPESSLKPEREVEISYERDSGVLDPARALPGGPVFPYDLGLFPPPWARMAIH